MAIPITVEHAERFREWCRSECLNNDGVASFSVGSCDVTDEHNSDYENLWEYHDINGGPDGEHDTSHDVYELFASVADEFYIEEEGWDSFIVSPK